MLFLMTDPLLFKTKVSFVGFAEVSPFLTSVLTCHEKFAGPAGAAGGVVEGVVVLDFGGKTGVDVELEVIEFEVVGLVVFVEVVLADFVELLVLLAEVEFYVLLDEGLGTDLGGGIKGEGVLGFVLF